MTEVSRDDNEERGAGATSTPPMAFGRYVLHHAIARGGMARVYTARLLGAEGFNRLVAAKRLHPQFTDDPDFVAMFHDEARIASKIHHPNVVPVLDVVVEGNEVILVQEYVHGVPLDRLFKETLARNTPIPVSVVIAIIAGMLSGLHAAHETKDDSDQPLYIVHRDVSPQNVMVSVDGIPRLLDFGIARARSSAHVTREGFFKGKVAYMAPEQITGADVTRRADIFAAGVLLWELLANRRMHADRGEAQIFGAVLSGALPTLTVALADSRASVGDERWKKLVQLESIVMRAIAANQDDRYATAAEMLDALLLRCVAATPIEVAQWVKSVGAEYLDRRQKVLASSEESWRSQSKIVSASSSSSKLSIAPENSGVKLAPRSMSDALAGPVPSWPIPGSAVDVREATPPNTMRARVPWMIAAALLLLSGILVGVVSMQGGTQPPAAGAPARAPEPTAAAVIGTVVAVPEPVVTAPGSVAIQPEAPAANAQSASSPAVVKPRPAPAAPPAPPNHAARWSPPAKAAAPTHSVTSPATPSTTPASTTPPSAPPPTAAPPTKADCDPPFYFEGTKKLYKPGCL